MGKNGKQNLSGIIANNKGFLNFGVMLFLCLLIGVVWFVKHRGIPKFESSSIGSKAPEKEPNAAGVMFSNDGATESKNAEHYYHEHNFREKR
jgi:Na+-transporting methylmalonyl-CoA/oxaloacetate decarboxylase gamma subunit